MTKQIRRKIIIQQLEKKLDTYSRRIRQMAENAYTLRQMLETILKENQADAICETGSEGSVSGGSTDRDAGQPDLSDSTAPQAVLEEQPAELPSNSGNIGVAPGSAV
jgi:hypothetical protein